MDILDTSRRKVFVMYVDSVSQKIAPLETNNGRSRGRVVLETSYLLD